MKLPIGFPIPVLQAVSKFASNADLGEEARWPDNEVEAVRETLSIPKSSSIIEESVSVEKRTSPFK